MSLGGEEGTSYVIPGNVNVTISAEMQNGKTISLNPGSFEVFMFFASKQCKFSMV